MEKAGLLDLAIAPLTLLERSRGWKRVRLMALYLLIVSIVGVFGWRETRIWRLPRIDEPFDVERFGTVQVSDAENAMIPYKEAKARLTPPGMRGYSPASNNAWNVTDWSALDPEVRRWFYDNRPVLEPWLRGTDRPDALLVQPRDMEVSTVLDVTQTIRDCARLAALEASRLEEAGDLAEAWRYYRAILRSSRHAGMHGGAMQRLIGHSILVIAQPGIIRWLQHPKVTPAMLRGATADIEACAAMTSPASEMLRAEYFVSRSALSRPEIWSQVEVGGSNPEPAWYDQYSFVPPTRRFFQNEPELSVRVLRLVTAGQLAQCDRPWSLRPRMVSGNYVIYDIDASTPRPVASITPEELVRWADRSVFAKNASGYSRFLSTIDAEPGQFDSLRLQMAERAFELERGRRASTYAELLGPYLKSLPEGIEPGDAAIALPAEK